MIFHWAFTHQTFIRAVIPAKAGIQAVLSKHWIPAFAGMTTD
jgi:hypothetical protein